MSGDRPSWQTTDFEDNLKNYLDDSPLDRLPPSRPWTHEGETVFRPIPSPGESRTHPEDFNREASWQPLVQKPRPIKSSVSWENDPRPESTARKRDLEPSYSQGRMLQSSPMQDHRPLEYTRLLPHHNPRHTSPPRYMREPTPPLPRGRSEERRGHTHDTGHTSPPRYTRDPLLPRRRSEENFGHNYDTRYTFPPRYMREPTPPLPRRRSEERFGHNFDTSYTLPQYARDPFVPSGRPEERFSNNHYAWRPQRQPANNGHDQVYIQNDFKPRPPSFDGKPDTWEPFLMQLRLMSRSYKWSDTKFREQLMFALRGEALLFASNLPYATVENTESLLQAMGQRFGQCLLAETHRANLYNLRKQSKENLQQYSARVSRLMSRAYPGMQGTAVFENLAIEHLLRGILDQKLAYEILTKKPRDLSEAIDMITWHEACHQFTNKTVLSRVGDVPNPKNSKSRERNCLCYNCRKKGHECKQCPAEQNQLASTDN